MGQNERQIKVDFGDLGVREAQIYPIRSAMKEPIQRWFGALKEHGLKDFVPAHIWLGGGSAGWTGVAMYDVRQTEGYAIYEWIDFENARKGVSDLERRDLLEEANQELRERGLEVDSEFEDQVRLFLELAVEAGVYVPIEALAVHVIDDVGHLRSLKVTDLSMVEESRGRQGAPIGELWDMIDTSYKAGLDLG
jgi:hypothetical protein